MGAQRPTVAQHGPGRWRPQDPGGEDAGLQHQGPHVRQCEPWHLWTENLRNKDSVLVPEDAKEDDEEKISSLKNELVILKMGYFKDKCIPQCDHKEAPFSQEASRGITDLKNKYIALVFLSNNEGEEKNIPPFHFEQCHAPPLTTLGKLPKLSHILLSASCLSHL